MGAEEDFVFYGKPIEWEEGLSSRKKKAVVESSGQLGSLPLWKQEELEGRSLSTASQFDTFGFAAAEHARKQAEKEKQHSMESNDSNAIIMLAKKRKAKVDKNLVRGAVEIRMSKSQ